MAIQTQGFAVRNMPQVSLANPALVAFNPSAASDGLMQAFKLSQQYELLKSNKALQAELEATRKARIDQQNALAQFDVARTSAETPTLVPKANFQIADINNKLALMPEETSSRMSDLRFNKAKNQAFMPNLDLLANAEKQTTAANLRALEPVTNAKIDEAVARGAQAQIDYQTSTKRGQLTDKKLDLDMADITDKMVNAKTDAAMRRAGQEMDLYLKNSMVYRNLMDADGRGTKAVDPVVTLGRFQAMQNNKVSEQKRLMETMVADPNGAGRISLAAYEAQTREPGTNQIGTDRGGLLWMNKTPKKTNPQAENMLKQAKVLSMQIQAIQDHTSRLFDDTTGGGMPTEVAVPQVSNEDQQALQWVNDPKNSKSPYLQSVKKKLMDKGLLQ